MKELQSCCESQLLSDSARIQVEQQAELFRSSDAHFNEWAKGYGVIKHDPLTQVRIHAMVEELLTKNKIEHAENAYQILMAADRIGCAGMWLVVHLSYASRVRTDGQTLQFEDFKSRPEGHTGGSLNMVPAYVGYLAMNSLDGYTRSWMMGQGHCVAAIDAVNVIVGNMSEEHSARYGLDDQRLSKMVNDFYSYAINADGTPESPLGSHVNAYTAGGMLEGGYLGFAELQYVHAPLPGERLVAFLSDGAFEEQRGSDWAPRWWRAQDSGLVSPIMILNGRRIEQRTQIEQQGGENWLRKHLILNGFDPIGLDGRDPASIVWGIFMSESRQHARIEQSCIADDSHSHAPLHYCIAESIKGFGFPGAGTNAAHNLPLPGNPSNDAASRDLFNAGCAALHVPLAELTNAISTLNAHQKQGRVLERDHALIKRKIETPSLPEPTWITSEQLHSPMAALDQHFVNIIEANPHLRPRVGNPDELRSNRLNLTLDKLKHRVLTVDPSVAESTTGAVITALNEEAVVCAALANKGGINLVVTYEAFAPKMLGAIRQELIFSRHLFEAGKNPSWLTVPIILTSHTWENSKNEQSHQDPTLIEALMGEMADAVYTIFPPDSNGSMAALSQVYRSKGRIAAMVIPKQPIKTRLNKEQAEQLAGDGVIVLHGNPQTAKLLVAATGAYQLEESIRAYEHLTTHGIDAALIYISEPNRLRTGRDSKEREHVIDDASLLKIFPPQTPRVFITHTRPEPFLGVLRRIDTGPATTIALGFINRGGTLDIQGMLFANRSTWAHVVEASASVLAIEKNQLLSSEIIAALAWRGQPSAIFKRS